MSEDKRADELYRACDSPHTEAEMERLCIVATHNRFSYSGSAMAGCYYCMEIWEPSGMDVANFCDLDEEASDEIGNATILCPFCGIDSVLASINVDPITEELLTALNDYWF